MDIWPETRNSVGSAPSIAPSCETRSSVYSTESQHPQSAANPLVTLEEATSDGHSVANSTPPKRARPRPVSEQMLGKSRPAGMYETQGQVLSILDAATNDLAQLINTLDLEATPHATPDMTPHRRRSDPQESPTKFLLEKLSPLSSRSKTLRESSNSMASLRTAVAAKALNNNKSQLQPASQTRRMVSQQIAPWPAADTELSPLKVARAEPAVIEPLKGVKKRLSHQRTLTPSPAPDNSPSFQPLRPAVSRRALNISPTRSRTPTGLSPVDPVFNKDRINSMLTFGSATSSRNSSVDLGAQPVFTKPPGHKRQQSSLSHFAMAVDAPEAEAAPSPAFDKETKRVLGLKGTMGESSIPDDSVSEDPDSDIPDELQAILGADSPAMLSRSLSNSPDSPPSLPLPTLDAPPFQLPAIMLSSLEQDTMTSLSPTSDTDDTKKSFDFTGEIKRLNESGVSHRRSFIEQLENAFKTPAKVDLRYGFEVEGEESFFKLVNGSGNEEEDVPPVPRIDPKYLQQEHELQDSVLGPAFEDKRWSAGDGELNKSFRFGGRSPQSSVEQDYMDVDEQSAQPTLTLSDIIPPPGHSPSPSIALTEEDSSVLNSIYEKAQEAPALNALLVPRPRVNSDTSVHRMSSKFSRDSFFGPSARSSIVSFTGLDSFEQVRRGFEFHDNRPNFYPPAANSRSFSTNASRRVLHSKHESTFSVASISSVGHVLNNGVADPFDYGLPSLQERPSSEDLSLCMSGTVDDTFSFMHHLPPRQRADSDASSFYFRPSTVANSSTGVNHRRRESGMSISSLAPPISLYNRSFAGNRSHHIRNDSSSSFSSLAHNYALHGANGGRAAWARHRQETSMDSVASDFSAMRLGRPGIGDKMFETAGPGAPLTSILASPMEDSEERGHSYGSSYDSIMDGTHRSSLDEDSLFEKTGYRSTSISDESIFGDAPAYGQISASQGYRPLSVLSFVSDHPPEQQDDTMISMLGGGHVRRLSVGSMVNASPCVNKRKYSHLRNEYRNGTDLQESPKKARIVEKPSFAPSLASVSSFKFGEERMVRATKGHFHRDSLEESCLIGQGEDNSVSLRPAPIFSRPVSSARSRSSTITTSSSGVDTPPLSSYDSSSQSEGGSVSSIDLSHVNSMLINATHPMTTGARARARARGRGHRTRFSQSHLSRSSVYETIEEEQASVHNSPAISKNSPTIRQAVYIVDPQSPEYDIWDDEQGIEALRRYYALRDEAQNTVTESKQLWEDTPFSLFALQSFTIPRNPAAMQALLEHSVKNYGNLPSELRQRTRSRTSSRASPYPTRSIRTLKSTTSPESRHQPTRSQDSDHVVDQSPALPLKRLLRDANLPLTQSFSNAPKPWESPEVVKPVKPCRENAYGLAPDARPRVGSGARRAALGWSKRSNGPKSSTGQKENAVNVGQGTVMTPSEGLRINRPRPKGRPTPASTRFSRVAAAS
jgi:serine/arginine repetitive matrix protein 2